MVIFDGLLALSRPWSRCAVEQAPQHRCIALGSSWTVIQAFRATSLEVAATALVETVVGQDRDEDHCGRRTRAKLD